MVLIIRVPCRFAFHLLAVIHSKLPHAADSQNRPMSAGNYSPRSSHDSDDSLRALELTEGPSGYSASLNSSRAHAPKSYSVSRFQFEPDLFQLTSTLDDPDEQTSGELGEKKRIGFMKGVALCVGLQVRVRRFTSSQALKFTLRLDLVYCMRLGFLIPAPLTSNRLVLLRVLWLQTPKV